MSGASRGRVSGSGRRKFDLQQDGERERRGEEAVVASLGPLLEQETGVP